MSKRRYGRPKKSDIKRNRYTVRLDDSEDEKVSEFCEKTGMTKSEVLRASVLRYLDGSVRKGE